MRYAVQVRDESNWLERTTVDFPTEGEALAFEARLEATEPVICICEWTQDGQELLAELAETYDKWNDMRQRAARLEATANIAESNALMSADEIAALRAQAAGLREEADGAERDELDAATYGEMLFEEARDRALFGEAA